MGRALMNRWFLKPKKSNNGNFFTGLMNEKEINEKLPLFMQENLSLTIVSMVFPGMAACRNKKDIVASVNGIDAIKDGDTTYIVALDYKIVTNIHTTITQACG